MAVKSPNATIVLTNDIVHVAQDADELLKIPVECRFIKVNVMKFKDTSKIDEVTPKFKWFTMPKVSRINIDHIISINHFIDDDKLPWEIEDDNHKDDDNDEKS